MFGYLDRLRQNLEILDEAIEKLQYNGKGKKGVDDRASLQWGKLLRDLLEQRNATLTEIKAHLLGRDETGAIRDPPNHCGASPQVMFERDFQTFLERWRGSALRLRCQDCGVESENVCPRPFEKEVSFPDTNLTTTLTEYLNLCPKCHKKRLEDYELSSEDEDAKEDNRDADDKESKDVPEPTSTGISAIIHADGSPEEEPLPD